MPSLRLPAFPTNLLAEAMRGGTAREMVRMEAATEVSVTLTWSSSMDAWQALYLELQREAESIFASSSEVVVVTPDRESGSVLMLISRARSLKLTYVPDKGAVRWDSPDEYGFERIGDDLTLLARTLMQRLRR